MGTRMMTLPGPTLYTGGPAVYLVSGRGRDEKQRGSANAGAAVGGVERERESGGDQRAATLSPPPPRPPLSHQANHRSWADFYLDPVATGGRAQMLSRLAVAVAFPLMMPAVCAVRAVVLFNRGKGAAADHAAFNAGVRAKMARSPMVGLIVYPEGEERGQEGGEREREALRKTETGLAGEKVFLPSALTFFPLPPPLPLSGHRSTRPDPLPFKHGMLRFAHAEGLPIQAVVSAGKEGVMAEKRGTARWGRTVLVAYGPPLLPADYPDFRAFLAAFTATFHEAWTRAHAPGAVAGASPIPPPTLDAHVYPPDLARVQAVVTPATLVAFLVAMAACARWVAGAVGRASPWVTGGLLAWAAVSAVRAASPPAGGVPQGTGRPGKPRAD